jgi:hypothetical protein
MALFPFSSIERSLAQGARANAAQAVEQNQRMAELRRQAVSAQTAAAQRVDRRTAR